MPERLQAFRVGLERHGFAVKPGMTDRPGPQDVFVTWNRIREANRVADKFNRVLVAENAAWGNGFLGRHWVSLARDRHNTAGMFPVGGPERWDRLGVELDRWRREGETVILPQRGIGSAPTAMPKEWTAGAVEKFGGRVRRHPGQGPAKPLRVDLEGCGRVVTWGSGAAIQALMWGVPVVSEMPGWIGEQDNTEDGRLAMFRHLAWAQWTLEEISTGDPLERLL